MSSGIVPIEYLVSERPLRVRRRVRWGECDPAGVAYTAGTGILLSGTTFSADFSTLARHVASNVGDGSSLSYTVNHNLGTVDVLVQVILNSTGETVEADVTRPNANSVTVAFASAPASSAYRVVIVG